jgi:uncharacterized membrane protein YoaK (UPF0700 family)
LHFTTFALMNLKINWDALGISASVACAIHCALLPLIFTSLPLFGVDIIENIAFEYGMIILALVVGIYSLYHGYKKHHHNILPIALFILGITCLFAKQAWHELQYYFLVPALILVVLAHYINYRFCKVHNHAHKEDCDH